MILKAKLKDQLNRETIERRRTLSVDFQANQKENAYPKHFDATQSRVALLKAIQ